MTLDEAEKLVRAYGKNREAWARFDMRCGHKLKRLKGRSRASELTKAESAELKRLSHETCRLGDDLMFALCGRRPTLELLKSLEETLP